MTWHLCPGTKVATCDVNAITRYKMPESDRHSLVFTLAGIPFTFELKTLGEKVGYCQNLPSDFVLLGVAIVFIDECNPSKIFKMASNSFKVTDVPF